MKAFLKNYRQSPRKVRLVAELIKSKRVADAILMLDTLPKRASGPIAVLLASAISNAKNAGISEENLYVENVTVNKGIVMKRSMPRARGSASRINKRTSHVMLTLVEKSVEAKGKAKSSKAGSPGASKEALREKKEVKKTVKKSLKTKVSEPKA
jgi:large subunit ribosomal protein L22